MLSILEVRTNSKTYPIFINRGIIKECGKIIKKIYSGTKVYIVTDSNVNRLYGESIIKYLKREGFETFFVEVKSGEDSKCLETLENICSSLLKGGITRGDIILNLGGGVVGDLGGFAASVLLRGIRYIQIPTTLIAQVDSSLGGKVGINLDEGKNLIGSFYQPEAVIIDSEFLSTLDDRYFVDGMGEVIKYACIKDKGLFQFLEENSKALAPYGIDTIIEKCCKIKSQIVEVDERDTKERMLLNFGHTLGHTIEKYYNYSKYSHGEAVALGMLHIVKKGEEMGLTLPGTYQKLKRLIEIYNLPSEFPQMDSDRIKDIVMLDKKGIAEEMNIVLIREIGEGFIHNIKRDDIDYWL